MFEVKEQYKVHKSFVAHIIKTGGEMRQPEIRLCSQATIMDTTKADTGLDNTKEPRDAMLDQAVWKDFVGMTRGDSQLKCVSALCTRFPLVETS